MKCVSGPWQPLLGAKGWDCMDIVASGGLADPAPGASCLLRWLWAGEFLRRGARNGSCFYQYIETIRLKLPGSVIKRIPQGKAAINPIL